MMFPERTEVVVAALCAARAGASGAAMSHVGALASVTLPASQVRSDTRLSRLNRRLRERPTASQMRCSTARKRADEGGFGWRTRKYFRRQISVAVAVSMLAFWRAHVSGASARSAIAALPVVQLRTAWHDCDARTRDRCAIPSPCPRGGCIGMGASYGPLSHCRFRRSSLRRAVRRR